MEVVTLVPIEEDVAQEVTLVPIEEDAPVAVDESSNDSAWSINGPRGIVAGAKQAGRDVANTFGGLAARTGGMMANFGAGVKGMAGDVLNAVGVENQWPKEAKNQRLNNDYVLNYINTEEYPVTSGVGEAIRGAVDSTVLMAPGMAAGPLSLATRVGAAALRGTTAAPATIQAGMESLGMIMPATLGMQTGVDQYGKKRSQDVGVIPSALSAGVTGAAEYGFERISTEALLKMITGGADNFAANLGTYFGKEIATELPTTVVQSLADLIFDKNVTPMQAAERGARYLNNESVATSSGERHQLSPELLDTAAQTAIQIGMTGAGGRVAGMAWDGLTKRNTSTNAGTTAPANAGTTAPANAGITAPIVPSFNDGFDDYESMPEPTGPLSRAAAQAPPAVVVDPLAPGIDIPVMSSGEALIANDTKKGEENDGGLSGVRQEVGGAAQEVPAVRMSNEGSGSLADKSLELQSVLRDAGYAKGDGVSGEGLTFVSRVAKENNLRDWSNTRHAEDYDALIGAVKNRLQGVLPSSQNLPQEEVNLVPLEDLPSVQPDDSREGGSPEAVTGKSETVQEKTDRAVPLNDPTTDPLLITPLDVLAHEAATSPTNDRPEPSPKQIEAGNYYKGPVKLHGLDISIENPAGSARKGVDEDGRPWQTNLNHHYGYIKKTTGADGDHLDVFVKPGIDQETAGDKVFVVDQKNLETDEFDESKVMLGFSTAAEAREAYLSNYDKRGDERILDVSVATVDGFKTWLDGGDTKKPFSPSIGGQGQRQPWQMTQVDFSENNRYGKDLPQEEVRARHKDFVLEAIERGDKVSAEVLVDYPDLQPGFTIKDGTPGGLSAGVQPVTGDGRGEGESRDSSFVTTTAQKYATALGQPISDYHRDFARAIESKNARRLQFLSNGLNDTGKRVFAEVTGVALPRQQGKTWEALMMWGELDAKKESLYDAMRRAQGEYGRTLKKAMEIKDGDGKSVAVAMVDDIFDQGFTHYQEGKTAGNKITAYLSNPDNLSMGHVLNPKGQPSIVKEYAKAKSELLAAEKDHDSYQPPAIAERVEESHDQDSYTGRSQSEVSQVATSSAEKGVGITGARTEDEEGEDLRSEVVQPDSSDRSDKSAQPSPPSVKNDVAKPVNVSEKPEPSVRFDNEQTSRGDDLLLPLAQIPEEMTVSVQVLDENGHVYEVTLAAQDALTRQDAALDEMRKLLDCVKG